jgi:hypothetical protein
VAIVPLLKVHCEILIASSILSFSCSPVALGHHAAHLSAEFDLILPCLSSLSPVSIAGISTGERVTTLVLIYLECPDVLFHTDETEIQTSFIVSAAFHFRFSEHFPELLLLACWTSNDGIDVSTDWTALVAAALKLRIANLGIAND